MDSSIRMAAPRGLTAANRARRDDVLRPDVAPTDARAFGGGTQTTAPTPPLRAWPVIIPEILGGTAVGWSTAPNNAGKVFASYYNLNIFRFLVPHCPRKSRRQLRSRKRTVCGCATSLIHLNQPKTVYTGTFRVWRPRTTATTGQPFPTVSTTARLPRLRSPRPIRSMSTWHRERGLLPFPRRGPHVVG